MPCCRETKHLQTLVQVALQLQTLKGAGSSQNSFLGSSSAQSYVSQSVACYTSNDHLRTRAMYFTFFTAVARPHPMSLVHLHLVQKTNKYVTGILSHIACIAQ